MKILNLGCGTKTSTNPDVINIDWSIYLRLRRLKICAPLISPLVSVDRMERLHSLPDNILVHNLAKGIPFESESVDVVYHSHVLEHLDKDIAEKFLKEVKRVLKPGGVHRIAVPDFEKLCRAYITHISHCDEFPVNSCNHDSYIAALIELSVLKEAYGTRQQNLLRRLIENIVLGDARRRGQTHQWMYDRINLREKLTSIGYKEVYLQDYKTSLIPNWSDYWLDVDENGNQYRPESLYVEACK
jgi:SAM-dependent methyltransferase